MAEWKDLKAAQKDYDLAVWMAVLMVDMKGMILALKWVYYWALTWAEYWV